MNSNGMKLVSDKGYSILEVMIFLAITGLLFASAVVAVGGNQQKVQYSQTVRDFEVQIKDVINDVSDGFYPAFTEGSCRSSAAVVTLDDDIDSTPGSNGGCINIGKIMMFNLDNDTDNFGVGTIVAANPGVGTSITSGFESMNPILAYTDTGVINLTTTKPIRYGSVVTKIGDTSSTNQYSSLSVISNFNVSAGSVNKNGVLVSSIYGRINNPSGLRASSTMANFQGEVSDLTTPALYRVNQEFYICLLTPDNKIARIFVGVGGVPTATSTEYDLDAVTGDCPSSS